MRQKEVREALQRSPLFAQIQQLDAWIEQGEVLQFSANAPMCRRGEPSKGAWIILRGSAETYKTAAGREFPMSVLGVGEPYGAATLFGHDETETDLFAGKAGCTVLRLPRETIREMLQKDAQFAQNYLEYLCTRVRFLSRRVDALSGADAASKVMSYLYSVQENGAVVLPKNMDRLAASLSISRASLYRAFDQLCDQARITKDKRNVVIL